MTRTEVKFLLVSVFLCLALAGRVSAQSAIIYDPSTDTVAAGNAVIGGDLYAHPRRFRRGGFVSVGPTFNYGFSNNIEIGANAYATRTADGWAGEFQPNFKWRAVDQKKTGVNVAFGIIGLVPIRDDSQNPASKFYLNASRSFAAARNARITGGIYRIAGGGDSFGDKTGALIAFEQPVTEKMTFVADWTSGRNKLGYSAAGINYRMGKQDVIVSYAFGNVGRANNFLSVMYSFTIK
jgi:hypothetical protein